MYRFIYYEKVIFQNRTTLPIAFSCKQHKIKGNRKIEKYKVQDTNKYYFNVCASYIENFKNTMNKNFPNMVYVYNKFKVGSKDFVLDLRKFNFILQKRIINKGDDSLTANELQLYFLMRKELARFAPFFIICIIPFTSFLLIPLAYYFPRYLFSYHYWSVQEKLDFMLLDHKKRLKHSKPLFRYLQAEIPSIRNQTLQLRWSNIVACLGSGTHPNVKDIIACSELFATQPFSLNSLKKEHLNELLGTHNISPWNPFKKQILMNRGMLIKRMDKAIQREGGTTKMSNDAIQWALSFRGVNPVNMSLESMRDWLEQWFIISNIINQDTISLLLHCPILLAYNHPNNLILIQT